MNATLNVNVFMDVATIFLFSKQNKLFRRPTLEISIILNVVVIKNAGSLHFDVFSQLYLQHAWYTSLYTKNNKKTLR